MADEALVRCSLQITKGNLKYRPRVNAFNVDVDGSKGPSPGFFLVSTTGQPVDLSQFTTPGLVKIRNVDDTNYVEWGLNDGTTFRPVGEILPGEEYVFRFSRNLGETEDVPGTGSTGGVESFYMRANTAAVGVEVDAFEA